MQVEIVAIIAGRRGRFHLSRDLRRCQISLKVFDKLGDVQAIRECVMDVDGDWHAEAATGFANLSKRNLRDRRWRGEVPRVREGGEVKPREHGESDQILCCVPLEVGSVLHPRDFDRSFSYKRKNIRLVGIVSKADRAIGTSDCASTMDDRVSPNRAVDDARPQVLDLMYCDQSAVNLGQEDGDSGVFGEPKRFGAIDAHAYAVKGFGEGMEELEECGALPGIQIDRNGAGCGLLKHPFMLLRLRKKLKV